MPRSNVVFIVSTRKVPSVLVEALKPTRCDFVTLPSRVRAARSDRELVDAFLQHVRDGQGASEREADLLADVLDERTKAEALA